MTNAPNANPKSADRFTRVISVGVGRQAGPWMLGVAVSVGSLLATSVLADSLQLRTRGEVRGEVIVLADVAVLDGEQAEALGGMVVGRFAAGRDTIRIEMTDVEAALLEARAPGAIVRRGSRACVVRRIEFDGDATDEASPRRNENRNQDRSGNQADRAITWTARPLGDSQEDLWSAPEPLPAQPPVGNQQNSEAAVLVTVRSLVVGEIARRLRADTAEVRLAPLAFGAGFDASLLEHTLGPQDTIALRGLPVQPLGDVRFELELDGHSIACRVMVQQRVIGVQTVTNLRRGAEIRRRDVTIGSVWTDGRTPVLNDVDLVIGQRAAGNLRAGMPVRSRDLQATSVIGRGDSVVVQRRVGAMLLSVEATALGDAAAGQALELRQDSGGRRITAVAIAAGVAEQGIAPFDPKAIASTTHANPSSQVPVASSDLARHSDSAGLILE